MGSPTTVLEVYEEALGRTPAQVVAQGRSLDRGDLAAIVDAWTRQEPSNSRHGVDRQVWPLVSHHTYGDRALFGTSTRNILPRALTLLLLHDGLVVADPLRSVHQVLTTRNEGDAVHALNQATSDLANVEPLIAAGVLRLTSLRPALEEENRAAVLHAFGLTPKLGVFTDFLEAAGSVPTFPGSLARTYAPQVVDLWSAFGVAIPVPTSLAEAEGRVRELAAAVIEVSWQFAVAAVDSSCDLAFRGSLERHLAEAIVGEGVGGSMEAGRHLSTLELGLVPNLDPSRLSLADALAIRREDAFESFRHTVRSALDHLETARSSGVVDSRARGAFEETMQEESRSLRDKAKRAAFRDRLKEDSIPAALGVVAELAVSPAGPGYAAGAAGAISVATVVWQWLLGRGDAKGRSLTQRYLSMLGGGERRSSVSSASR